MTKQNEVAPSAASLSVIRVLDSRWDGRSTLTVEEAADVLGLSRATAYAAANAGDLPIVRVGRRMVVPRFALEQLLMSAS